MAEENLDVAQESLATTRNSSSTNNNKDVVSCPSLCSDWFKSKKDYDNDLTKHLANVICSPAPSFMRRLEEIWVHDDEDNSTCSDAADRASQIDQIVSPGKDEDTSHYWYSVDSIKLFNPDVNKFS